MADLETSINKLLVGLDDLLSKKKTEKSEKLNVGLSKFEKSMNRILNINKKGITASAQLNKASNAYVKTLGAARKEEIKQRKRLSSGDWAKMVNQEVAIMNKRVKMATKEHKNIVAEVKLRQQNIQMMKRQMQIAKIQDGLSRMYMKTQKAALAAAKATKSVGKAAKGIGMGTIAGVGMIGAVLAPIVAIVKTIVDFITQWDDMQVNLVKKTGFTRKQLAGVSAAISTSYGQLQKFGISMEETVEAASALVTEFGVLKGINAELITMSAEWSKAYGTTAEENAKMADVLHRQMGLTIADTKQFARTLGAKAYTAGVSVNLVMQDIVRNSEDYLMHLSGGPGQFNDMLIKAKKMGLEMKDITSTADAFMDYETALSDTMELNTAFGMNLNAERLHGLAIEGKYDILQQEILDKFIAEGKQFDQLTPRQKKWLVEKGHITAETAAKTISDGIREKSLTKEQAALEKKEAKKRQAEAEKLAKSDKMLNTLLNDQMTLWGRIWNTIKALILPPLQKIAMDIFPDLEAASNGVAGALQSWKPALDIVFRILGKVAKLFSTSIKGGAGSFTEGLEKAGKSFEKYMGEIYTKFFEGKDVGDGFKLMLDSVFETVKNKFLEVLAAGIDMFKNSLSPTLRYILFSGSDAQNASLQGNIDDNGLPLENAGARASGALVTKPTRAIIGEAGPEMVVPLTRRTMSLSPAQPGRSLSLANGALATGNFNAFDSMASKALMNSASSRVEQTKRMGASQAYQQHSQNQQRTQLTDAIVSLAEQTKEQNKSGGGKSGSGYWKNLRSALHGGIQDAFKKADAIENLTGVKIFSDEQRDFLANFDKAMYTNQQHFLGDFADTWDSAMVLMGNEEMALARKKLDDLSQTLTGSIARAFVEGRGAKGMVGAALASQGGKDLIGKANRAIMDKTYGGAGVGGRIKTGAGQVGMSGISAASNYGTAWASGQMSGKDAAMGVGGQMAGTAASMIPVIGPILGPLVQAFFPMIVKAIMKIPQYIKKIPEFLGKLPGLLLNALSAAFKFMYVKLPTAIIKGVVGVVKWLLKKLNPFAEGGIVTRPTTSIIGERGPEAIVPLNEVKSGHIGAKASAAIGAINAAGGGRSATPASSGGNDNSSLIAEMRAIRAELAKYSNRPIVINLDGKKVASNTLNRMEEMSWR